MNGGPVEDRCCGAPYEFTPILVTIHIHSKMHHKGKISGCNNQIQYNADPLLNSQTMRCNPVATFQNFFIDDRCPWHGLSIHYFHFDLNIMYAIISWLCSNLLRTF